MFVKKSKFHRSYNVRNQNVLLLSMLLSKGKDYFKVFVFSNLRYRMTKTPSCCIHVIWTGSGRLCYLIGHLRFFKWTFVLFLQDICTFFTGHMSFINLKFQLSWLKISTYIQNTAHSYVYIQLKVVLFFL